MNTLQLAAFICGLFSFIVIVLHRFTATNRPERIQFMLMGMSVASLILGFFFLFLSIIIKP